MSNGAATLTPASSGATDGPAGGPRKDLAIDRLLVAVFGGVYLVTLAALVIKATRPLADPDTWWHLVMGHKYLDGTSVRHPGPMSAFGTEDWHSRDWISQLLAAKFDDWFGLAGVAALTGFTMIGFVVALLWATRARGSFVAASLATALGVLGSAASLTPRPQVASFLLLALTVGACLRTVDDLRPRWWLVPLTGAWACIHGFWFVGIAVQAAIVLGLLLDRRLSRRDAVRIGLLPLASVAAVAVTPNGLYELTHPVGETMGVTWAIVEYQPPTLGLVNFDIFLLMLAAVAVMWARRGARRWAEILLVGMAVVLALHLQRTIPLGAVIVAPFFCAALETQLARTSLALSRRAERLLVGMGALAAVLAVGIVAPQTATEPSEGDWPTRFEPFLADLPPSTVVFNELGDGGYLAWRLPGLRIVGDGLSDQYDTAWLNDYFRAVLGGRDSYGFVVRTGATYALLYREDALTTVLPLHGWHQIDSDDDRVLLAAPGAPA